MTLTTIENETTSVENILPNYDTVTKVLLWNNLTRREVTKIEQESEGNDSYIDTYLYNKWRNMYNELPRHLRNEYNNMQTQHLRNRWFATYLKLPANRRTDPPVTLLPLV
jgi:hypothetical protein